MSRLRFWWLNVAAWTILILILPRLYQAKLNQGDCSIIWGDGKTRGTLEDCKKKSSNVAMMNYPIFKSIHCFNNGSGLCKGISGRLEVLFDVFKDQVIGPLSGNDSRYFDENGYHKRVPIAYDVNGDVLTNDRVINWATQYTKSGIQTNLLELKGINWCMFVESNNWPYRSAIKVPNSEFHVYFFNKQSCIIHRGKVTDQYNTRFTHKSTFRADQDMNPLIFIMEDDKVKDGNRFRMVKNKRQHWTETKYEVTKNPNTSRFYIKIEDSEEQPQIINNNRHILSAKAYRTNSIQNNKPNSDTPKTNSSEPIKPKKPRQSGALNSERLCLRDPVRYSEKGNRNWPLVQHHCSLDEVEMADMNKPTGKVYEADLHCLPKHPKDAESFFGVNFNQDKDWEQFAKHGYAFSAFTTIPVSNNRNKVKVLMMYASWNDKPEDEYDEHYPKPYISYYNATYNEGNSDWTNDRDANSKQRKNMNFVDDIAYLPKCNNVLIILGALYTQMTVEQVMDENSTTFIGSIQKLGVWEMTNAFFADDNDNLWFYHRTNYVVKHRYECSKDGSSLVTAERIGEYQPRHGGSFIQGADSIQHTPMHEEDFWVKLEIIKGPPKQIKAPDPNDYPYSGSGIVPPPPPASNVWLYVFIGVALLIILTMCIICMIVRRRRRLHKKRKENRLSRVTQRSGIESQGSGSRASAMPTNRSSITQAGSLTNQTFRSNNISSGSSDPQFSKSSLTKIPGARSKSPTAKSHNPSKSPSASSQRSSSASQRKSPSTSAQRSSSRTLSRTKRSLLPGSISPTGSKSSLRSRSVSKSRSSSAKSDK